MLLQHLVHFEPAISPPGDFQPVEALGAGEILHAQTNTANWLENMGAVPDEDVDALLEQRAARDSFKALTFGDDPKGAHAKASLLSIKTPDAIRQVTGMLAAYDWEFVEHAKEIRGYVVTRLVTETDHPDARIRLRALELLGRVTEVSLFTDRVEIQKSDITDKELEDKIRAKLNILQRVQDVQDIVPAATTAPTPPTP